MARKYIVEVTEEGIKRTFIDGDKTYEEKWIRDENGIRTEGDCITAQIDQYGNFEEQELFDLLDEEDLDGLWDYFAEGY